MTTYDAIIPAGGALDPDFAAKVGTTSKALIPFEGQTTLGRTLRALKESGRVNRAVLVGSPEVLAHPDAQRADERVAAGTSGPDTILRGLKHLASLPDAPEKILIVTADLPFLTPAVIQRFVDLCPTGRDVCVPLITETEYIAAFPNADATFIPLRDGVWTAGCAYVMDVAAFRKAMPHLERLFLVRKSKIGMLRLLGLDFVFKYLTKRLTIQDVENKIIGILGCSGAAVMGAPPELAYDIDDREDYEYALTRFEPPRGESR